MRDREYNLKKINAIFLLFVIPILIRIWWEAVIWRLDQGPQMLGFSLMHGGAGWLSPILMISWLSVYLYLISAIFVSLFAFVKGLSDRLLGKRYFLAGAISIILFANIADYIQEKVSQIALYCGVATITITVLIIIWLSITGMVRGKFYNET